MAVATLSLHSTYPQGETKKIVVEALKTEQDFAYARLMTFAKECEQFEQAYNMASNVFFEQFESGDLGDDEAWFDWYAAYKGKLLWQKKYDVLRELSWNE